MTFGDTYTTTRCTASERLRVSPPCLDLPKYLRTVIGL